MKKSMFLMMLFGLLLTVGSSAAAQNPTLAVNSGGGTPAAGQQLLFRIHARSNDEKNAPAGTKYFLLTFVANGKNFATAQAQISDADQNKYATTYKNVEKISKLENPIAFRAYDNLKFTAGNGFYQIEVIRSNKSVGVMKLYR